VWTTFSADQVDLDYRNPEVLARIVEVLLDYASRGVAMIRLDAVCFLAKEEGTPSIHLPQTHAIVQFLRSCLDATYPEVGLISETNVPHEENITYLGDGVVAEAQAVYQFSLPPLVLHSFATGDATALANWARQLEPPPPGTTFLNFLASHDGVGLRPLEGLLDPDAVDRLAELARASGGLVNSRGLPDGTSSPYELNATWFDLVRGPTGGDAALDRHLGSHAIMLAMRGIPAVYVHSFLAGRNDLDAIEQGGQARAINRHKFIPPDTLEAELADPLSRASRSLEGMKAMLAVRRDHRAFHPDAPQRVLETPPGIIGIEREDPMGASVRVYVNVSGSVAAALDHGDLLLGRNTTVAGGRVQIGPWGMAWVSS
jgi:sucrose phosphorylase